ALGRFAQADTIVPEPGNPRSLNRYSYVGNQPTIYNDPSGNCPWCIAAVGGAVAGASISWARQVIDNRQSGMDWRDAALTVDIGEIAGAATAGAIVGGTFGAVGAVGGVAGLGLRGMVGLGATSNVVANQASSLVKATVDELAQWVTTEDDVRGVEIIQSAKESGFLNPYQITFDAASGAVSGGIAFGASSALTSVAQNLGWIDKTITTEPIWTVHFLPGNSGVTASTGRTSITVPTQQFNAYLIILIKNGPDKAARWLFNQARSNFEKVFGEELIDNET
ncbi:MAG: hypothetical protein GY746_04210, partial [Gammaproteobacteria bacterium]|nr:hypothetical protein [Gammaproteobacteria bacterium]